MLKRPRRNRKSPAIRALVEEAILRPSDLVAPFFVIEGHLRRDRIATMPGIERLSIDLIVDQVKVLYKKGIRGVALFPSIDSTLRDDRASEAFHPNGLIPRAIRSVKREIPEICIFCDIALDPFTSDGHDGIVVNGDVHNDKTIEMLVDQALIYAENGADFVAPSDMMDGRVLAIRNALDKAGFHHTGILSYSAKYASSLYGPYRDALNSANRGVDKKTYQLNPANAREAIREACLDEEEGADMLMVKPALLYLDIIRLIREQTSLPICGFHVSGEYSMVMAAHERGMLDADKVFYESLVSIKRAGADFIISYAVSRMLALWSTEGQ